MSTKRFLYRHGPWSGCSVSCGRGVRRRDTFCVDQTAAGGGQQRVPDAECDAANATRPEAERLCDTVDCAPDWFTGEWERCSATCGPSGLQFRVVYCQRVHADGRRMTVADGNCTGEPEPTPEGPPATVASEGPEAATAVLLTPVRSFFTSLHFI